MLYKTKSKSLRHPRPASLAPAYLATNMVNLPSVTHHSFPRISPPHCRPGLPTFTPKQQPKLLVWPYFCLSSWLVF